MPHGDQKTLRKPRTGAAPSTTARAVKTLAEKHGVEAAASMLGCASETVARIAARLPVRPGTLALAEKNLAAIQTAA